MDKKLVGLITVFLLVFGVFMSFLVFGRSGQPLGIRASGSTVSCQNSFVFANQLNVEVGAPVTILAYVRNESSVGLANIAVTCSSTLGTITPVDNPVTNSSGNATYSLVSDTPGLATISCSVASCGELARNVTVQFGL